MSKYKDFICESEVENPRTITYGDWTIESRAEGGRGVIYIYRLDKMMANFWISSGINEENFLVCDIITCIPSLYIWLNETSTSYTSDCWMYRTWEDVDKLMQKLVNYIRNK